MPDANGNPTLDEILAQVGKEEIIHRAKSDPVKISHMWMKFIGMFLGPLTIALVALIGVAATNIPSFTEANQTLTNTMATMHPWETNSYPSWTTYEETTASGANVYLRMEFVMTAFMQRIFDLGWTNVGTDMMMRVRIPNAVEGEIDTRYYSTWISTAQRVAGPATPLEGEAIDRTYALSFGQQNLPPEGLLTDGASYQCEFRLLMANPDSTFFREYVITTDWYDYTTTTP